MNTSPSLRGVLEKYPELTQEQYDFYANLFGTPIRYVLEAQSFARAPLLKGRRLLPAKPYYRQGERY